MSNTHFDSVCYQGSVLLVLCTVTVKLSLYMPQQHTGEVEAQFHSFFTSIVDGGEWSALPRKEHPVLTEEVATRASIDTHNTLDKRETSCHCWESKHDSLVVQRILQSPHNELCYPSSY